MLRALIAVVMMLPVFEFSYAAMSPQVYQKARADAPYHFQIAIKEVVVPKKTPALCAVKGEIVQIFRDSTDKIELGKQIEFGVSCMRKKDVVPIGGTIWTNAVDLSQAQFIEAYLIEVEGEFDVVLDQTLIIEEPSNEPQFPVDQSPQAAQPAPAQ